MWSLADEDVKATWKAKAEQVKLQHQEKHPNYSYQPRKASEKKRRMTKKKLALLLDSNQQIASIDLAKTPSSTFSTPPIAQSDIMTFLPMNPNNPMQRTFDVPTIAGDIIQLDSHIQSYNTSQGLLQPEGPLIQDTSFTGSVFQDHADDIAELNGMFPFDLDCDLLDLRQPKFDTEQIAPHISPDLSRPAVSTTFEQIAAQNTADQPRMRAELQRQEAFEHLMSNDWSDTFLL
jgi:hypothetical protein